MFCRKFFWFVINRKIETGSQGLFCLLIFDKFLTGIQNIINCINSKYKIQNNSYFRCTLMYSVYDQNSYNRSLFSFIIFPIRCEWSWRSLYFMIDGVMEFLSKNITSRHYRMVIRKWRATLSFMIEKWHLMSYLFRIGNVYFLNMTTRHWNVIWLNA